MFRLAFFNFAARVLTISVLSCRIAKNRKKGVRLSWMFIVSVLMLLGNGRFCFSRYLKTLSFEEGVNSRAILIMAFSSVASRFAEQSLTRNLMTGFVKFFLSAVISNVVAFFGESLEPRIFSTSKRGLSSA